MFRRFASGSAVAAMAIAFAVLVVLLLPVGTQERFYPLTIAWCFVPAMWGLWAVFTPAGWMPQRLPFWGAILGLMAGVLAAFVLNLPSRILGQTVSVGFRGVGVVAMVTFYFFLWMLVRAAFRSLASPNSGA
jgi:hypothetical protein